jgi:hypothetical protein
MNKGKCFLLEFPKSNQGAKMNTKISKTLVSMSIKHDYQKSFIAKQPCLDPSLCQLIYFNLKHKNKQGDCKLIVGYSHAFSS